jgi:hypothetical protein
MKAERRRERQWADSVGSGRSLTNPVSIYPRCETSWDGDALAVKPCHHGRERFVGQTPLPQLVP